MQIIIYSTPSCPYCNMAKQFFTEKKIEYKEVDVSDSEEKAKEMVEKSGQMGVPVIAITQDDGNEEIVIGFDQAKIESVIA